jgi:hypothetical protein
MTGTGATRHSLEVTWGKAAPAETARRSPLRGGAYYFVLNSYQRKLP